MTRRTGLALLLSGALLMPLVLVPKSHAENTAAPRLNQPLPALKRSVATAPSVQPSGKIHPNVLKKLGLSQPAEKGNPEAAADQAARQITGNPAAIAQKLPPSEAGRPIPIKPMTDARSAARFHQSHSPSAVSTSGLPAVLNPTGALSTGLITAIGGVNTTVSEVDLLADWDGREDMTADRGALLQEFAPSPSPSPPLPANFAITRTGISEHTFANGHQFNSYYYGDTLGNLRFTFDLVSDSQIDFSLDVNIPTLVNTGTSNGFNLTNPTPADCMDTEAVVTGIAVNPVANLGDLNPTLCDITGEVIYVSTMETAGCALNGSGQPIRTRIFAFAIFEIGGTEFLIPEVLQIARTSVENLGGLAVDDDGSLYFSLVDLSSVNPVTGLGGLGGAIFKATELPRTVCTNPGRINRVITDIPGLTGATATTLGQATPIVGPTARLTNYSGTSPVFGNVASLAAGPNNAIYAALAASNTGGGDPTQGVFNAGAGFPSGLPSMVVTLVDATGRFDSCSALPIGTDGVIPVGDGVADPAGPGATETWRAFVLGNGPDIRPDVIPFSFAGGTVQNTLKVDLQIDATIYSGISVNEEGTVFVISGGTPSGVGANPSPTRSEILGFEDKQTYDRRGDYVDFRGDNPPAPPASGGNTGDGDSDRFDHIYYQAPIDVMTSNPLGLAGLARGFLRYTNRLAPDPISPGVTLGAFGGVPVQGDDDTTEAAIIFENLDPSHQVAGGDDQTTPFRGDDSDGLGTPILAGANLGGFEFTFGGPVVAAGSVWNGFFLNSNGNITFGEGETANNASILDFRSSLPKIAPAWNDINPASRASDFGTFPVQALGFANVNAFKIRWINAPEFGSEICTAAGGGVSNKFSITLYDDGRGIDENNNKTLNPANPTGDNIVPFDLLEGPTDLRFVPAPIVGALPTGEPPRPDSSGQFIFEYGRMDQVGRLESAVLVGYSIGGLSPLNPPGLCESNLSELSRAAETDPFRLLSGNQTASLLPGLIGEGTEATIFEFFNGGVVADGSATSVSDFDLRFEGNDAASSKPATQIDQNRERIGFFGAASSPPANPVIQEIIITPGAFTPDAGTDLLDALGTVDVEVIGSGFFPNEATRVCQGVPAPSPGIPVDRAGKTVTTAMTLSIDNNSDGIADAVVALGSITPISRNHVRGQLRPLATAPGTAFPFGAWGGSARITLTTTFTSGDNNHFGPFTRSAVGVVTPGLRAPIVLGVTQTAGDCSAIQDVVISGFNFSNAGTATAVFAVDDSNPGNIINATSFSVVSDNIINATFNFGGVNAGKKFLIFVTGPGGTSRNIFPTVPPGTPAGVPLGNERGNVITFNCAFAVAPDTLQFNATNQDVTEESTTVNLTVTRLNPSAGTVTVDYSTGDVSATQKGDYEFAAGTLTFGPGEVTKTIPILINEDSFVEGTEAFLVTLSNPIGGGVTGAPISITILDDDVAPSGNVIDNASDFVRQHYHDFLNRDADAAGLAFWTDQITSCGADAGCIELKRINVSAAFFLSVEFQETGGNVLRTQRVAFGRKSNDAATRYPYTQFMRDAQQVGRGVIIGQPGADALLEQNKQAYALQIVSSAAFITRFPLALDAAGYVDALFASAGVVPTTAERNGAIAAFGASDTAGRVAALRHVADSASVRQAEFNAAFVLLQYYGYLRRNPTDAPDGNDSGYQFWLNKLNSFNGNFIQADMVKAFLVAGEYRQRFGP